MPLPPLHPPYVSMPLETHYRSLPPPPLESLPHYTVRRGCEGDSERPASEASPAELLCMREQAVPILVSRAWRGDILYVARYTCWSVVGGAGDGFMTAPDLTSFNIIYCVELWCGDFGSANWLQVRLSNQDPSINHSIKHRDPPHGKFNTSY